MSKQEKQEKKACWVPADLHQELKVFGALNGMNLEETAKYFINLGIMKHRLKSDISVVSEAVSG
jgi:hypothetical protein